MFSVARHLGWLGIVATAVAADAQEFPATARWMEQWLAAEKGSAEAAPRKMLDDAVKELLVAHELGFAWLHSQHAASTDGTPQRKCVDLLATNTVIEFLRQKRQSGITFAGQFEPLRALQPFVGELLFGLLVDTPQWYPHTHRVRLVRPLRDLHPQAPSEARMAQITALVDSSIEPEELRRGLACLLWQWGSKQPAQQRLEALRRESGEGDAEDRVRTLATLAELQYELLDYRASAATHRSLQALAKASDVPLKPMLLYASACSHALSGDVDRGIECLDQCAALQASPDVDASLKLARSVWENDPEITVLRRDPRYPAIFARAFPPAPDAAESTRR